MGLEEEISAARAAATQYADDGEELVGVIPTEPGDGRRVYLCAYRSEGDPSWIALDETGAPVADPALVRDAVSIAALCELAEENAGGGDLGELRARLVELRLTENPQGIEEAEQAAAELQETIEPPPRVATLAYLDSIGRAVARLEQALGEVGGSPFAAAMKSGIGAADDLAAKVERSYKAART